MPNKLENVTSYGNWKVDGDITPVDSTYRLAWRVMAATTGFRTFYPAIIPPGAKHVDMVFSAGPVDSYRALLAGVVASSLLGDFYVRSSNVSHLRQPALESLPLIDSPELAKIAVHLFLRLNCISEVYANLWKLVMATEWNEDVPLRNSLEREKALVSLDVIVGISLGLAPDELCMVYRTHFPVMRRYDKERLFDKHGRLVPKEIAAKTQFSKQLESAPTPIEHWTHPSSGVSYAIELPFQSFNREAEIDEQYRYFADKHS